jgi:hypothetical protein
VSYKQNKSHAKTQRKYEKKNSRKRTQGQSNHEWSRIKQTTADERRFTQMVSGFGQPCSQRKQFTAGFVFSLFERWIDHDRGSEEQKTPRVDRTYFPLQRRD